MHAKRRYGKGLQFGDVKGVAGRRRSCGVLSALGRSERGAAGKHRPFARGCISDAGYISGTLARASAGTACFLIAARASVMGMSMNVRK